MTRFLVGTLTFITLATSPMLAFAAGARGQTFEEIVTERVVEKMKDGDLRTRITPTANVCGNRGEGYQVEVLVKVVKPGPNGQLVAKLVHVKTMGAIENIFFGPKIVECVN